jgi:hypothetical protein
LGVVVFRNEPRSSVLAEGIRHRNLNANLPALYHRLRPPSGRAQLTNAPIATISLSLLLGESENA